MNPVVHFEIPYDDAERVARFYQSAFGWETQALGPQMGNYVLATTSTKISPRPGAMAGAIDGGLFTRQPQGQHPSVVIGTLELRESMRRVAEAGGQVLGEPMDIPGVGAYVAFLDSEGNRLSMLQPLMQPQGLGELP